MDVSSSDLDRLKLSLHLMFHPALLSVFVGIDGVRCFMHLRSPGVLAVFANDSARSFPAFLAANWEPDGDDLRF